MITGNMAACWVVVVMVLSVVVAVLVGFLHRRQVPRGIWAKIKREGKNRRNEGRNIMKEGVKEGKK